MIHFDDNVTCSTKALIAGQNVDQDQAGLLLTETLMLALVGKGAISGADFIEIVEDAAKAERAFNSADYLSSGHRDRSRLSSLATAYEIDPEE